ncbi:MAG: hypothetical protein ACLUHE_15340 [Christensenellales bacterium]
MFDASFRLPGADALSAFADLLGGAPDEDCGSAPDMQEADFTPARRDSRRRKRHG